jgi:hypothetical protein
VDEWTDIFMRFSEPKALEGDESVEPIELFNKVILKTPAKSSNLSAEEDIMIYSPRGIRQVVAQAQDTEAVLALDQSSLPKEVTSFLSNVLKFLLDFDHWWKTPLSDTYSSLALVKEDLYTLKQRCKHLHLLVGKPMTIANMDFPDLWSALEFMSTNQRAEKGVQIAINPNLSEEVANMKTLLDAIPEVLHQYLTVDEFKAVMDTYDLSSVQDTLAQFHQRFNVISSVLQQFKTLKADVQKVQTRLASTATGIPGHAATRIHPLLQRLQTSSRPASPAVGSSMDVDVSARLNSIDLKLSMLENRMVEDGVSIGSFTFQSLDDVRSWCQ